MLTGGPTGRWVSTGAETDRCPFFVHTAETVVNRVTGGAPAPSEGCVFEFSGAEPARDTSGYGATSAEGMVTGDGEWVEALGAGTDVVLTDIDFASSAKVDHESFGMSSYSSQRVVWLPGETVATNEAWGMTES